MRQSSVTVRRLLGTFVAAILNLVIVANSGMADEQKAAAQAMNQTEEWKSHLQSASRAFKDGRSREAEREYNKALKGARKLGKNGPEVAECLCEMADFYLSLEKYKKARKKRGSALKIEEKVYGAESPEVAASLYFIADALVRDKIPSATSERISSRYGDKYDKIWTECQKPLEFLNRAQTIQAKSVGTTPLDYSKTLVLKVALEVERMHNGAVSVGRGFQQALGASVLLGDLTLEELESLYLEECDRLRPMCDSALAIQQAQLEPNHPDLVRAQSVHTKLLKEIEFLRGQE